MGIQPCPKPEKRATTKRRKKRQQHAETRVTRAYIFERDKGWCRCCLGRRAESMHEIQSRGAGGKRSKENSIAVCGSGTTKCHGFLQTYQIRVKAGTLGRQRVNAEYALRFQPMNRRAAAWIGEGRRLSENHRIEAAFDAWCQEENEL